MTAEGMAALSRLQALEDLNISKCWTVSDQGLEGLVSLKRLRALRMNGCDQVTDAGTPSPLSLPSSHHHHCPSHEWMHLGH